MGNLFWTTIITGPNSFLWSQLICCSPEVVNIATVSYLLFCFARRIGISLSLTQFHRLNLNIKSQLVPSLKSFLPIFLVCSKVPPTSSSLFGFVFRFAHSSLPSFRTFKKRIFIIVASLPDTLMDSESYFATWACLLTPTFGERDLL